MDPFVRSLMSLPAMGVAEEQALARRARGGDAAAREALITSGLRSVALRGCMLGLRGDELQDAVQSGAIGLIHAVDRFDPDRGARLATYAWRWIGAEMVRPARREVPLGEADTPCDEPPPDRPDRLEGLLETLSEAEEEVVRMRFGLSSRDGEPMTRRAVADRLGLTVSQVRTIEGKAMRQLRGGLAKVVDRAPHQ